MRRRCWPSRVSEFKASLAEIEKSVEAERTAARAAAATAANAPSTKGGIRVEIAGLQPRSMMPSISGGAPETFCGSVVPQS